jgi:uncharacterized membrane protein YvbJ
MPICVDCGEEILPDDKNCPYCGSPTRVKAPDEVELRLRETYQYESGQGKRRMSWIIVVMTLLILMLIFVLFIAKSISTQLGRIGTGF